MDAGGALVPGTETFDLYLTPGAEWLSVWSDEYQCYENVDFHGVYPPSESLFSSLATLRQYDVIVLNCGYGSQYLLDNADVRARIHDFVQGGGRLYVTDRSYDFVEQVFPNYIRFQNGDEANPATPEPYDAAEAGVDYFDDAYTVPVTSNASVLDPDLAAWLSGMGSLNPDGTVHVEDFLYRWSVMVGPHTGTIGSQCKVWVEGSVPYYTSLDNDVETETGVRPLTVSFHYGTGKVIYTSYHTALDPHPGFTPQERILEYLLFESAR